MKQIIPIMLIASAPLTGMAQNKSGIVVDNLDKTTNPTEDFYKKKKNDWKNNYPITAG